MMRLAVSFAIITSLALPHAACADIIVAEGESFKVQDDKGWRVTHQNDSYGSHTYGGMWMSQGGCLGAPADKSGSVALRRITVKDGGKYRVWSKYQAPPYFNYLHQIEVLQNDKVVFSHVYGKRGTDRLWSFGAESDELWWPWGVDHDAAESPSTPADLAAGDAVIRLTAVENAKPAGDRFVDFVLLSTNLKDDYKGFKPYAVGSPFANEALDATELYLRFKNITDKPARLSVARNGHFQPQYGAAKTELPPADPKAKDPPTVAVGEWSAWHNVGPFCRLVHDEGLFLTLAGAKEFDVQVARDAAGKDVVGDMKVQNGEAIVIPIDVTWKTDAKVKTSREHALEIMAASKSWRKANAGKRPKEILYYGAFTGTEDWVGDLKALLGYNTQLPAKYDQVKGADLFAHAGTAAEIQALAKRMKNPGDLRVLSFGDEIGLGGGVDAKDAKVQDRFRVWLKAAGLTHTDLGTPLDKATLGPEANPRVAWYAQKFVNAERFAYYRGLTKLAKELFGPKVLTGANFAPHHGTLYYGSLPQWNELFKQQGMSLFWAEDYIFSVPELPQIISWEFAQMRCATKYHQQPIHFYVMPHAPGQEPGFLRRNMVLSVGYGARHIDSFWIAPAERFTENYISWQYRDQFRVLSESIYDSAEAERLQAGGKLRPARIAVVLSEATDFNESRFHVDKKEDPFAAPCKNAPAAINQTLCRKEQQLLYLALRHAQHAVDLITEADILEGALKDFDVVHFAGEWVDERIVPALEAWVKAGGVLYACAGLGRFNRFGEPENAMLELLGLKEVRTTKDAYHLRTLLELPLCPPIDTITVDQQALPAIALKQQLTPTTAKPIGEWSDRSIAATVREHGKGKAYAIGALPGTSYMKTALRPTPWARGGRHTLYNPVDFSAAGTHLVRLGIEARPVQRAIACSSHLVEAAVTDHKDGTLVSLINWTNSPLKKLIVNVRLPQAPREIRSVQGRNIEASFADGLVRFTLDLDEADYVLLMK
jgi:hypothetical protein